MNIILEVEIGITGGVDSSGVSSTPEDTWAVYTALSPISEKFTIAAAFGNAHGVYKPGNVKLQPELLGSFQAYAKEKLGSNKPLFFVFQGGSGSEKSEIEAALEHGVVKINVDTDTQWAYWQGILKFYQANEDKLQGQIGNKDGADKPNKSYCTRRAARLIEPRISPLSTGLCFSLMCARRCFLRVGADDPRKWVREAETSMVARVQEGCKDLRNVN